MIRRLRRLGRPCQRPIPARAQPPAAAAAAAARPSRAARVRRKPAAAPSAPAGAESPVPKAPAAMRRAEKPAPPAEMAVSGGAEKLAWPREAAGRSIAREKPAHAEKPAAPAAAPGRPASRARAPPFVTEPKDVKVIWAGQLIGKQSDRRRARPRGPAKVTLERERWQVVTVDVNAQAGVAASVHERLRRPRGTLAVSSSPPGAQISVNRVAAGAAPKQIDVQRFEKVPIKATLKGYQPWTKTIYLKEHGSEDRHPAGARK